MQRLISTDPTTATGKAKDLLDATQKAMGIVPNLMKTLASSPATLGGYLAFNNELHHGQLPGKIRERLAVTIAEYDRCGYCASAHTALGKMAGLQEDELLAARRGTSADPKAEAAIVFAHRVLDTRGQVSDADLTAVREAGFSDGEIAEIVGHVALNVFTNYFNNVAQTEIDFPVVELFNK